jgi:acetyltransferase-like isoleucine patch superfamily enzyme
MLAGTELGHAARGRPATACAGVADMTVTSFEGKTPVIGDVRIGARCWVGPGARLRGDYAVVGMNAVVSDWAEVGESGMIAAGVPARLLDRAVDDDYHAVWRGFKETYVGLCERYREGFGR